MFRDFNERFAELGLTQSLWSILVLIEANPGLRQSDIGVALNIRPANLVDLLDLADQARPGAQAADRQDRRASSLYLTHRGGRDGRQGRADSPEAPALLQERLGDD